VKLDQKVTGIFPTGASTFGVIRTSGPMPVPITRQLPHTINSSPGTHRAEGPGELRNMAGSGHGPWHLARSHWGVLPPLWHWDRSEEGLAAWRSAMEGTG
jgi:hypothetical protein